MIPVLASFGNLHLYSYGLCIAIGVLLSVLLMKRQAQEGGFPGPEEVFDLSFLILVWGFLGARVFYILQNLSYYLENPFKVFAVWEGGLILYGGVIASFLGVWITAKKKKWPVWKILDFFAPYTALSQAFGRLGCFMNGCCYGKACGLPWAVLFPGHDYAVHPAQIYEALYDLLLFFFLQKRRKKSRFEGEIVLLYLLLYGFGRYLVEFLREPTWVWLGLTSNQWLSVGIMTAAFLLFRFRRNKAV